MTVEVRSSGGDWEVFDDGSHHSYHYKKARAVDEASRLARSQGDQLVVQRRNGTFQYKRDY